MGPPASWSTSKERDPPQCKYYGSVEQSDLTALNIRPNAILKGLAQAKIIKKSVILFWLLNMTI